MRSTLEDLMNRSSPRSFTDEPVSREDLDAILQAGICAPNARNEQAAVVVAVTNKKERDELSRLNAGIMGMDADPFYGAPIVCVVFADAGWAVGTKDGSLVLGNMLNAAYALGLGGRWIDRAEPVFETEEGKTLMKKWGVPEGYAGVGHCVLGHTNEKLEPKPKKPGRIIYSD